MTRARLRLLAAAVLFFCWIGYLVSLVATVTRPVVFSRPQLLVSTLDVVAYVEVLDSTHEIQVNQVLWPATDQAKQLAGKKIAVTNLAECVGWNGPGDYLVPLVKALHPADAYRVASTPHSPGIDPRALVPHMYPFTNEVQLQLKEIHKP